MTDHEHPEIEDRITAELVAIHTELGELRAETRAGFGLVGMALSRINETLETHSIVLKSILEALESR